MWTDFQEALSEAYANRTFHRSKVGKNLFITVNRLLNKMVMKYDTILPILQSLLFMTALSCLHAQPDQEVTLLKQDSHSRASRACRSCTRRARCK